MFLHSPGLLFLPIRQALEFVAKEFGAEGTHVMEISRGMAIKSIDRK
jgi:hypothetical protein